MSDQRAKSVLKEAVDAVVNSFAKHTHGYGRGKYLKVCSDQAGLSLSKHLNMPVLHLIIQSGGSNPGCLYI